MSSGRSVLLLRAALRAIKKLENSFVLPRTKNVAEMVSWSEDVLILDSGR